MTRTFNEYRFGDPFSLREFSEKLHNLVQNEFGSDPALFPKKNRFSQVLRDPIAKHIFGQFDLAIDTERAQKRIVLRAPGSKTALPYLVWSAGQREFVPLLLGFYWLCPSAKTATRGSLKWAIIEELEMGLHPQAISVVLTLVLELLSRGYKVCISTHSPHVLDVIWALRFMKNHGGDTKDVRDLFHLPAGPQANAIAASALKRDYRVYYFTREGAVRDISNLDPGAEDAAESGWGGLTEFSGWAGDIVARVARRFEAQSAGK
ncbi:MAG: AAA family ATPase [Betaproteobacteria bacterium]